MDNPILTLLNARKAGRSISSEPLPESVIAELIEAVRLTPSCFNNQPWRFLFLESPEALAKGQEALSGGNRDGHRERPCWLWAIHGVRTTACRPMVVLTISSTLECP